MRRDGLRPSFYLRLPDEKRLQGGAVESIRAYLKRQRIPLEDLRFQRVMKHTFYGFTAKRFYPFLEISFPSPISIGWLTVSDTVRRWVAAEGEVP